MSEMDDELEELNAAWREFKQALHDDFNRFFKPILDWVTRKITR